MGFSVSPFSSYPACWENYPISYLRISRGAARRLTGEIRTLPLWDVQLPAVSLNNKSGGILSLAALFYFALFIDVGFLL